MSTRVHERWNTIRDFAITVLDMAKMAWHAFPFGFAVVTVLDVAQGLIPLATAWMLKTVFDLLTQLIETGAPGATSLATLPPALLFSLVAYIAFSALGHLLSHVNTYLNSEWTRRLQVKVRLAVYEKVAGLGGLAPFENPRFHDTVSLAVQGAQHGPSEAISVFSMLLRSSITLFTFLGVLLSLDIVLTATVLLSVLPHLYLESRLGKQRFRLALGNSPRERRASYYANLLTGSPYAKEVQLFSLAPYFLGLFRRITLEINNDQREQQKRELRSKLLLVSLSSLVAGAAFVVIVLRALEGHTTIGDVVLYLSAVVSIQAALSSLAFSLSNVNESVLFFRCFKDLFALPQPLARGDQTLPVPPLARGIEFRDVSFRYSSEQPWILRNVSFFIPAGQCVALVGLNGAGKTTLVKLLSRLYDPTEGQILWDGIDIRDFDLEDLRRHLGVIFQDFIRYDLTARENVGLGNIDHLDDAERVRQAAAKAKIEQTIEKLPQGYDTILSRWLRADTQGIDLSGGEWQKVALARMFMRDAEAELMILDEPTASLDAKMEHELYLYFTELVAGRTSLLITHRFSTIRMANVIAVLEEGKITEYGNHNELILRSRTYSELYNMQAQQYQL